MFYNFRFVKKAYLDINEVLDIIDGVVRHWSNVTTK